MQSYNRVFGVRVMSYPGVDSEGKTKIFHRILRCERGRSGKRESTASSHGLPPPVIDIRLQLPRNRRGDPMLQPHVPQQRIIPFLV